ncbi:MAG TPA: MarR family transcriptional regulator [Actinomycetota bacterium]|nr:MarR family transcriptional regulator [Actinomycetota bacterium]
MRTPVEIPPAELAARLRVAGWRFARRMRRESAPGITPTVHAALHSIEVHGPMTAGQLAAHEHVQKPTMTRTIAAMVEQGLVVRRPDPLDGRVTWLTITPEGRKLLQRARRRTDEFLAKRVRALSPDERATLDAAADLLERLAEGDR